MSSNSRDLALDALFHPFNAGLLRWAADGVLFLRAREGAMRSALRDIAALPVVAQVSTFLRGEG